jgi:hypothetical protein
MNDFCTVENKKIVLATGLGIGAYLLFKGLQLRQTVKNIQAYVQGIDFDIFKTQRNIRVIPNLIIVNPIGGVLNITNIFGTLTDESGNTFGRFQTGAVKITGGSISVKVPIIINGLNAFIAFTDAATNNKWPKLKLNYTIALAGGILPISQSLTFDTAVIQKVINWK